MKSSEDTVRDLNQKIEAFQLELNSINHSINTYKVQIGELSQRTDLPVEFGYLRTDHQSLLKEFNEFKSLVITANTTIKNEFFNLKSFTSEIKKDVDFLNSLYEELEVKIQDMKVKHVQMCEEITTNVNAKFQAASSLTGEQFKQLKNEFIASPSSIIESNEKVMKAIEGACLDASNALLKVNNVDLQNRMFERKLENFNLIVKKMELDQQNR